VGVYPGTAPRLVRGLPGGAELRIAGLGLGLEDSFRAAMEQLGVELHELEFDLRLPPSGVDHLLSCPVAPLGGPFDICLCTEVIEHQMHPAALLLGLNRLTRRGGTLLATTNSVSFIGDIAKLAAGRHNVEALERSHIVSDSDWRPHIRLYTLAELRALVERAGFEVLEACYFDNGNVYAGGRGLAMTALRRLAGRVPHLRSHVFVMARRTGDPDPALELHLRRVAAAHGLERILGGPLVDVAPP
jgi:SAM-dependent methyltransferase